MMIRPISIENSSTRSNKTQKNINFKGEVERRMFQTAVDKAVQASNGKYKPALKEAFLKLLETCKTKYTKNLSTSASRPNEFTVALTTKNNFKVKLTEGRKIEFIDKETLINKRLVSEITYETPEKKPIIYKKTTTSYIKKGAPKDAKPFVVETNKIYDKELNDYVDAD